MCSHSEEEPGPPLKAKVIGRCAALHVAARVGDVADAGDGLVLVVADDQRAGGGGVLDRPYRPRR